MGESLPLPVVKPVSKAQPDAEPAGIADVVAGARLGQIVNAVSGATVARLSGAVLGAVVKALSDAVLDAVVVRVLDLISGRVSVAGLMRQCGERKKRCFAESTLSRHRRSFTEPALSGHGRSFTSFRMTESEGFRMAAGEGLSMTSNPRHSERSEESSVQRRPREQVLLPTKRTISHESTKCTKRTLGVAHVSRRAQFLGHERGAEARAIAGVSGVRAVA